MKILFLLTFLTISSILFSNEISAKGLPLPYCSSCEYVEHVADLPDNEEFYSEEHKTYVDLGYIYNQFWVIWLPIWNSDGKYVLKAKDQEVYFEVSEEDLKEYRSEYKLDLPESPISLWNKLGGKVIIGLVIGLIAYGYFAKGETEEETKEEVVTPQA